MLPAYITISFGGEVYAVCMHRFRLLVKREVWQGQVIANVGYTGYSTGTYLHFEIRQTASM
ncbi:M23 family metallopeptidase [Lacrimispora sp.]|uniref:M23 family metallopeptidase n=1 Tax=Lacrimispora sp. TaxID=2719234 RepID=UPI003FA5DD4E